MASTSTTAPIAWHADGQITASGDTAVHLQARSDKPIYWWVADDATLPTIPVAEANLAEPHPADPAMRWVVSLVLKDGEVLNFAATRSDIPVNKTVGPA